jgi:hypothetical protein
VSRIRRPDRSDDPGRSECASSVAAGVRMAEAVVGLRLSTSKICTYAEPVPNPVSHWPLSRALGLSR